MRTSRFTTTRLFWTASLTLAPFAAAHALHAQTAVRSAQPTVVSVEAGGAAGELIVQGSGLDQVRSVEVTLSGRVFTGVGATIGRASTSELLLRVTASADVHSTSGLRVVLVTARQRVEVPATLDVLVPPSAPPPSPPDPVVQAAGSFVISIAEPVSGGLPPDPVTQATGVFVVVVTNPTAVTAPPQPVTATAGTFVVTIAPPGSGGN